MAKVTQVNFISFFRPPSLRTLPSSALPWITAAGSEEEAGLEEGVREDVEEAGRERADADAEQHEAELAHGASRRAPS